MGYHICSIITLEHFLLPYDQYCNNWTRALDIRRCLKISPRLLLWALNNILTFLIYAKKIKRIVAEI